MSSQVLVLAIIAFIAGSNAQLVSQDQCDQTLYSPMADFDATKVNI